MIDCGADWQRSLARLAPSAILLTHGHRDHAFGLARGAPCPVFATEETWDIIGMFPIADRRVVAPRKPFAVGGIRFEAFRVQHSVRAPAVGYRIAKGRRAFFYVPDVARIEERHEALRRVAFYIGDGASIVRSMVRRRDHVLIGHAPIKEQLSWCAEEGVRRSIFTHCGSGIVAGDARQVQTRVEGLGLAFGVEARVASDGLTLSL